MAALPSSLGRRVGRRSYSLFLSALFASAMAGAQPNTTALNKARAQFQQGLALETAGDWAGALALFQEVAAVKMTPQVRFNIALCEEHLGRLAIALGDYKLALAEAEAANVPIVAEQVPGRIEMLNAKVPKVLVRRGNGADYATILIDGVALGAASIGKEMPVDPGPHTIEARAPGFNMFMNSFNIGEREAKTILVTLARTTPVGELSATGSAPMKPPPPPLRADNGGTNYLPYVAGGIGVAGLVASGIFFAVRSSAVSDLDAQCGPQRDACPPGYEPTESRARTFQTLSAVSLALGVAGVGAGVVLYFVEKPSSSSSNVEADVAGTGNTVGMRLRARF